MPNKGKPPRYGQGHEAYQELEALRVLEWHLAKLESKGSFDLRYKPFREAKWHGSIKLIIIDRACQEGIRHTRGSWESGWRKQP